MGAPGLTGGGPRGGGAGAWLSGGGGIRQNRGMTYDAAVDAYLTGLPEPQRGTLQAIREALHRLQPGLTEGMSYGCPAFLLGGKKVAGLSSSAKHVSYLPHSGSVTTTIAESLAGYSFSKGAVKLPADRPPSDEFLRMMLDARLAEL